jgi:hypothetical protein
MLSAPSPAILDKAIDTLLMIITRVFSLLQMEINWKPGKTEALLQYRGKNATSHLDSRRYNGKLMIPVPNSSNAFVNVVMSYKHLGCVTSLSSSDTGDAKHKASSAMQAYSPLAVKLFGSPEIPAGMKLSFMQSLVLSRLLFNAHVIVPSAAFLNNVNAVYMRVLRRITGDMRFSEDTVSDIEVRRKVGMPSIDCVLQQNRLKYLRRVLVNRPRVLVAALHQQPNDRILPWVKLVLEDLDTLRRRVGVCQELPPPRDHPNEWSTYIGSCETTWREVVSRLHYVHSVCDRKVTVVSPDILAFECTVCLASQAQGRRAFATHKASLSHMRVVHSERIPMRRFVPNWNLHYMWYELQDTTAMHCSSLR